MRQNEPVRRSINTVSWLRHVARLWETGKYQEAQLAGSLRAAWDGETLAAAEQLLRVVEARARRVAVRRPDPRPRRQDHSGSRRSYAQ